MPLGDVIGTCRLPAWEGARRRTIRKPGDLPNGRNASVEREVRMAFPVRLVCLSTLLLLPSASVAEGPPPPTVEEHITVHATRLPDEEEPVSSVPAHVTVLTREDLARTGARTLQDALALEAGVILYDEVGNDVEKTLDLRGFSEGTGTAVFLDGVRLNDPRNNAVALESIPLEAVDRIEIIRGSAAGLIGGGAQAGVIRVLTRTG